MFISPRRPHINSFSCLEFCGIISVSNLEVTAELLPLRTVNSCRKFCLISQLLQILLLSLRDGVLKADSGDPQGARGPENDLL